MLSSSAVERGCAGLIRNYRRDSHSSLTHFCVQTKKNGGAIYQSISKITSLELCVYPDKPGSPKVVY